MVISVYKSTNFQVFFPREDSNVSFFKKRRRYSIYCTRLNYPENMKIVRYFAMQRIRVQWAGIKEKG